MRQTEQRLSRQEAIALLGSYLAARDKARSFVYDTMCGDSDEQDAEVAELIRRSWAARLRVLRAMTR